MAGDTFQGDRGGEATGDRKPDSSRLRASISMLRYTRVVRRLLSFMLLLVFSLPLIPPALALAQGPESNLPLCCRRNGAHHCAMMMHRNGTPAPGTNFAAIPQRCPAYPALVTPLRHVDLAAPAASAAFAEIVSHPAIHAQTKARARISLDCARHKRGPPSVFL